MELRNFARALPLLAAAAILVLPLAVQAAPPGGGGGNKVSVTAANPADAFQGEELDVIVSGSGFDAGSQVSYLVTGTTDASQVEVLSVQYISSTELKTRIRPKDAALPSEYDIQVQTSSGRKGKGTTLFRVKVEETACTSDKPEVPTIAYLTAMEPTGDLYTADLMLASDSGCDQYLLLEGAEQEIRPSGGGLGEVLFDVSDLRLDFEANIGIVIWRDRSATTGPRELNALKFSFNGSDVMIDPLGPQVLHVPPDDWRPYRGDIRINESGGVELVQTEKPVGIDTRRLVYINIEPDGEETRQVLAEGDCPILDAAGSCFRLGTFWSLWNNEGDTVFFTSNQWPDESQYAITRIRRTAEGWQDPEVLMKHEYGIEVDGVRNDGLIAFRRHELVFHKNGRVLENRRVAAVIDPNDCHPVECLASDGYEIVISGEHPHHPGQWTRDGGMLYGDWSGNSLVLRKSANPLSGAQAPFTPLGPINNSDDARDTSF